MKKIALLGRILKFIVNSDVREKIIPAAMLIAFLIMLSISPGRAFASSILEGEWGMGNFNKIVYSSADSLFISPYMDGFLDVYSGDAVTDWAVESGALSNYFIATGTIRDNLAGWRYINDSFEDVSFSYDVKVYLDDQLMDWATVYYSEGALSEGGNYRYLSHSVAPVPAPSTILLLGLGLLGVVIVGRRKA